jgi:hypothetical protein
MAFWDNILDKIGARLAASVVDRMAVQPMLKARAYRGGYYQPQLKVTGNQFDDNIGINLVGLLVNRVVSQMLGAGFTLDFAGDAETEQERYVNAVLEANQQEVLFHRAAVSAAEAGTGYLMILPDGITGEDGKVYPRLQLIDPLFVAVETLPEDYEVVIRYTIEYKFTGADDKEHVRRRVVQSIAPDIGAPAVEAWEIVDYELVSSRWVEVGRPPWPHPCCPMLHWQNLPASHNVYGEPDLTPAQIELQNRINLVASNISKLIRYYAHPMRFSVGANLKDLDVAPGKMVNLPADGDIRQLEALGDLSASMAYLTMLRQAFFACGRVVDMDSVQDKLGNLTNFGLRVLYQDNLNLIATHRELFGDMLEELARRLQIIAGMEPQSCAVVWPDFLPVNEVEAQAALAGDLANGLVSKQTAAGRRGYDWDTEQERLEDERASEDTVGAAVLRAFSAGRGGGVLPADNPERNA